MGTEALAALDKALNLKPDFAEVYNGRGMAKLLLENYHNALADCDEAIRLKPDYIEAYNTRGNIKLALRKFGKHDGALADLNEAIHRQPDFVNAYANRGIAQLVLNNIEGARSDLQTALEFAEYQENNNLKTYVEERLQELNNFTPQDSEN